MIQLKYAICVAKRFVVPLSDSETIVGYYARLRNLYAMMRRRLGKKFLELGTFINSDVLWKS